MYGGSEHNTPWTYAASANLHYVSGPTIQRAHRVEVAAIPFVQKWEDSVGLFGAENKFLKFVVRPTEEYAIGCISRDGYACAQLALEPSGDFQYEPVFPTIGEFPTVNSYEQAIVTRDIIPTVPGKTMVKVEVVNNGTGNIYDDDWLDVRLYGPDHTPHPESVCYIPMNSEFYVGFHARDTRRLPYDIDVKIGETVLGAQEVPPQFRLQSVQYGSWSSSGVSGSPCPDPHQCCQ